MWVSDYTRLICPRYVSDTENKYHVLESNDFDFEIYALDMAGVKMLGFA